MTTDDAIDKLLARLRASEGDAIPTSTLGRMRRTAGMAARAVGAAAKSKLTGNESLALDDAMIARLVMSLGELKGIAMKVGQILSYIDAPVPSNVRRQLAVLQAQSQPTPFADIERTIREDLAERAPELLVALERSPASAASIGQVHRGALPDGTPVAVKVLHPGIKEALRADFRGAQVGKHIAKLVVPGADVADIIAEAERTLLDECDYLREAANQRRFGDLYARHESILVPAVHGAWSSSRVLTTTWHTGKNFDVFAKTAPQQALDRAGAALFRFYVATFYEHGFFNADPHPGNMLFHDDGRVVFLDYGCVREFSPHIVRAMAQLSTAVRAGDDDSILAALSCLGARVEGRDADQAAALELARAFFAPVLQPGPRVIDVGFTSTLQDLLKHKRSLLKMHLPGELLFLVRIRFGAYSVLSRLGACLDWRSLEAEAATNPIVAARS